MNKKEAAAWLNVSEKTLERAVKDGKLSARMEKGKTRDILVFDDDELVRFKEQREQPHICHQ
jgi:excisionase family DNA binding protein